MSEEITAIVGKTEYVKDPHTKEIGYKTQYLNVGSFYGGTDRGSCIQLTLDKDHIQLPKDKVILLRDALIQWLDTH